MQEVPTRHGRIDCGRPSGAALPPVPNTRLRLRLGIGGRLALGLAAVSAVIVWGHVLATRTTRMAVEAVQSMQTEHEPRAQRASAVVESLVAYDRAVIEYLQSGTCRRSHQYHRRGQFARRRGTDLLSTSRGEPGFDAARRAVAAATDESHGART